MKIITVSLADIEGVPHGSASANTNVKVTARYTSPVVLADGRVIPQAVKGKQLANTGAVEFSVYASDDPAVAAESQGFAVRFEAQVANVRGEKGATYTRTVKPLMATTSPVSLGSLAAAEPVPAQWVSVAEVVGDFDARLDALESGGALGIPVFATQAEAQAHEAANPGSVALWFDDGLTSVGTVAPTFTDVDGTSSDVYVIPAVTGVDYKISGAVVAAGTYAGSGAVTIAASPQPGYSLTGTTSWSHTFGTGTAPTPVTPTGPTWTDATTVGGGSWTTPTQAGVTYSPASGTATPSQSVTVTATAQAGYILQGTTSWTHAFPAAPSLSVLLADDFERADTGAGGTLGTATAGGAWADSGSAWRVTGGRAVTTANLTNPAVLGPSIPLPTEYEAKVSFGNITANSSNGTYLKARYGGESTPYYRVEVLYDGSVKVFGWSGTAVVSFGSAWETAALTPAPAVGDAITVKLTVTAEGADNRLRLYVNGVDAGNRLDASLKPTGKSVAIHNSKWYFSRFDEVTVKG